ncbi:MAG: RluA family pseudouridine synthase [Lachnospiraceae bacterium]|nr:RluA family pseudouridine synthase [Lachnospiraceae bacterium]
MIVNETDGGIRVDKYLAGQQPEMSRSFIQKLIEENRVTINGIPVKSRYKVSAGEEIICEIPKLREPEILPENIPLTILYEDEELLVVNKPKGMVVHPGHGHDSGTLVNALLYHCRESLSGINGVLRPGIVHRIDRDTSGVLVVCKSDRAHSGIAEQLKVHSITRVYHAIAHGVISEEDRTIRAPIGRDPKDRLKMAVNEKNGKDAVTHIHVLERLPKFTYVTCSLETGRTHQIRVHMASIRHPLLGDPLYGPKKSPISLHGQALHAKTLGFVHPTTGKYMEFEAELPEEFLYALKKCRAI